jgi:hypothetical protein
MTKNKKRKNKIFLAKKIIILGIASVIGYFSFVFFLRHSSGTAMSGVSDDIILRKNFLVRTLGENSMPRVFSNIPDQQAKGEYALVTYSMATFALTNIAMERPEMRQEFSRTIEKWINLVLKNEFQSFDSLAWGEKPLDEAVLEKDRGHIGYYGHLNLMLGAYSLLNNDGKFGDLHKKISDAIDRRMKKYSHRHVETYPGETYPPDNTVAVASLQVSDMTLGKKYEKTVNEWIEQTKKIEDQDFGMIPFQIDSETGESMQTFRGSNMGWNSFFLPLIDESYAKVQFERFRKKMTARLPGFAAFKEYPSGHFFGADRDSGPIIFGLSATATGFSVAGARHANDQRLFSGLIRTIEIFGMSVTKNNERHYLTMPIVSDAMILAMKTATNWKPLW